MVPAPSLTAPSLVHGLPLAEEPGIGALTIPAYLEEIVARYGDREAVVLDADGERLSWSYRELRAQAMAVARALVAGGIGKHGRVGILMTNRPEFLAALFGTAMAGGVAVALSTFSTPQELDYLIATSEISVLLYEERILKKDFRRMLAELDPAGDRYPFLTRRIGLDDWLAFLAQGEAIPPTLVEARSARVHPADPAGIFFSSGTTSLPKGIVHDQRAFAIQWWRWPRVFGMRDPVRSWTGNGFFWSGNVSMVVGTALSTGGAVVLQRFFDEAEALRLMDKERVSFANGRPHQWARLQAAPNWAEVDLSSLKYVPRGELLYEHPTVDTDWRVPMAFGTTETMTICTSLVADTPTGDAGDCGKPLPGNTLKIVDPLSGAILPRGARGEMCIKGPTLMRGYLGKAPEECFDAEGFYCTGDGGRVDAEGRFFWEGRLTDMIKTGGANVAPEEVDSIIANYPGVKRSQTVGVPDDLLGEMVVTCIVPMAGAAIDDVALTAHLKTQLASFKVPRRILVFTDDEFALTGNEKIKAADVRTLAIARMAAGAVSA
ncbi:long-chain fatty acid--CoA ligase [Sphingomonas oligophenolica]